MPTGLGTSYDLTVGIKINMDEAIYVLSPLDSPMLTGMDADGLSIIGSAPVDEVKFSWMDEQLLVPRSNLGAALTTAQTVMTVATGGRLKFSTGDIIRLVIAGGNESVRVTSYGTTTDTLVIVRAYDSTTAANYVGTETVIGVGTNLQEGSDPEAARTQDRETDHNFTQIYGPTAVNLTGTEQSISKYGITNEFARQVYNRTREHAITREQALVYGRRNNDTGNKRRTSGGLDYFITTNTNTTNTTLTVANVQTQQQKAFNQGGVWDRLVANPKSIGDLNETADTARVRQEFTDAKRGRIPVMTVFTEFGPVTVVRNRWVHPFHAFGFSRENVVRRVLRPLMLEKLAKTGDADKVQILCEEGLEVKGEEHMTKWTALTYADT